jgi:NAD(P)-dependent dehydrogenase (short-subunit alcohol dehydrogenase family)
MSKLEGKIALVTGATGGIGQAITERFVSEGAHVYVTGRRGDALADMKTRFGEGVTPFAMEGTRDSDVEELFALIEEQSGHLDALVANAGVVDRVELQDVTREHFDSTFSLNVRSTLVAVQRSLPLLTPRASIVIIGSATAHLGLPGSSVYSATKAALRSFVRTWTAEWADRGIRANVLSPGPIDTPIINGQAEYFGMDPQALRAEMASTVPLGRLGRPEEVAAAALFLASSESSFVVGSELSVDGGMGQV